MRKRAFRDSDTHQSIATGYGGEEKAPASTPAISNLATEKQQSFILTLLGEKDLRAGGKLAGTDDEVAAAIERIKAQVPTLSKKAASEWIGRLIELPNLQSNRPTTTKSPKVGAGRYALEASTIGDGSDSGIRFYKVSTPDEGKWAGYTFVDAGAGGPHGDPLWHPIRNREHKRQILEAIAKDPKAALLRYGQELGHCGHCGRTLTDETSRELGIGPICRGKLGW